MLPNSFITGTRTFNAEAIISIDVAPPTLLFIKANAPQNIANEPPKVNRLFPISSRDMLPNSFKAFANINIEVAISIMENEDFTIPLVLPKDNTFSNKAMEPINSPNRTEIAPRDDTSFSESIDEIVTNDIAKIPIAPAIFKRVSALRLLCHASRLPLTPSNMSVIDDRISPVPSVKSFNLEMSFLTPINTAANIPELTRSKLSPKLRLLNIPDIASFIDTTIFFIQSIKPAPPPDSTPIIVLTRSATPFTNELMVLTPIFNTLVTPFIAPSNILELSIASLIPDINSPIADVTFRKLPPTGDNMPINSDIPLATAFTAFNPMSKIENIPLNVLRNFPAVSSLILNDSVSFFNEFIALYS